ncbi:hypothetical protein C8F01DRAFT_1372994 [Mycena amicta]|nr:hypothetical protein C8F01DRAFT_1372994 [Mycena amicta]
MADQTPDTSSRPKKRRHPDPGSPPPAPGNKKRCPAPGGPAASNSSSATGAPTSAPASGSHAPRPSTTPAPEMEKEPEKAKRNSRCKRGLVPTKLTKVQQDGNTALQQYIRSLCGVLTSTSGIPKAEEEVKFFQQRFDDSDFDSSLNHIRHIVDQCMEPNATASRRAANLQQEIKGTLIQVNSRITNALSGIPSQHLAAAFDALARVGLRKFIPDVHGSGGPGSAYNQTLRHIAVTSFQATAIRFGLTDLNVSQFFAKHHAPLRALRLLRRNSRRVELHGEDVLVQEAQITAARRRRHTLAARRFEQAYLERWRKPILRLVMNEDNHSDDELLQEINRKLPADKNAKFHVCEKPMRNLLVTSFFRDLDARILAKFQRTPKPGRKPEGRKVDQLLPPSKLSVIQPEVDDKKDKPLPPIDFFTPTYYNHVMDMDEKILYADGGIAFPHHRYCNLEEVGKWRSMPTPEFMKEYRGDELLGLYARPTPEEIEEWEYMKEQREEAEVEGEPTAFDLYDSEPEEDVPMDAPDAPDAPASDPAAS